MVVSGRAPIIWRHSLRWGNPFKQAPGPRVLIKIETDRPKTPPGILAAWRPGGGYAVTCQPLPGTPPRRWSQKAKARARQRNLRQRLERKLPLFADQLVAEELERRPDYYAARDPE